MRILSIHAHPDDESSKGAGTIARYAAAGVRAVLVTATGGEAGDILNPAMDRPEVEERLTEIRGEELAKAAAIIGYADVHMLGYRDSGMPGTEDNGHARAFANADAEEALGALVGIVRSEQPEVVLGYDDHERYPHPDHLRVHDLSLELFDAAADVDRFPDAGEPWQIQKLYAPVFTMTRLLLLHRAMEDQGLESPFTRWVDEIDERRPDDRRLTQIDVGGFVETAREALRAHRTQVDPDGFWFQVPTEMVRDVYPYEDFELLRSRVGWQEGEDDLFAGVTVR